MSRPYPLRRQGPAPSFTTPGTLDIAEQLYPGRGELIARHAGCYRLPASWTMVDCLDWAAAQIEQS